MKKYVFILFAGILIGCLFSFIPLENAQAKSEWVCYYPENSEIISSEFSTGGGKKALIIIEVDCKFKDGSVIKYLDSKMSASGFLGLGRFTIPDKIIFKKWKKDKIELEN